MMKRRKTEVVESMVLDFDPKKQTRIGCCEQKVYVNTHVKFMFQACFESIERVNAHPSSGCLPAHHIGSGKSLQIITLVHTVLTQKGCNLINNFSFLKTRI